MKKAKAKHNKRSTSCVAQIVQNNPGPQCSSDPELFEKRTPSDTENLVMATWVPPCAVGQNYWSDEYQARSFSVAGRLAFSICSQGVSLFSSPIPARLSATSTASWHT